MKRVWENVLIEPLSSFKTIPERVL